MFFENVLILSVVASVILWLEPFFTFLEIGLIQKWDSQLWGLRKELACFWLNLDLVIRGRNRIE